jgi:hypothetical protein
MKQQQHMMNDSLERQGRLNITSNKEKITTMKEFKQIIHQNEP